ncbi:MAG: hypothetical protein ACMXYF_03345 [Candidatus Woesearchaeota archaeon]
MITPNTLVYFLKQDMFPITSLQVGSSQTLTERSLLSLIGKKKLINANFLGSMTIFHNRVPLHRFNFALLTYKNLAKVLIADFFSLKEDTE